MRGLLMVLPVLATLLIPTRGSLSASDDDDVVNTLPRDPAQRADLLRGVESNLLSLFGFQRRPRPERKHIVVPPAMMRLYKEQTGQDLDTVALPLPGKHTTTANTVRSFTHEASPVDVKFPTHRVFRLSFDLAKIPKSEQLKAAELQLSRDPQPVASQHRVVVQDIILPGIVGVRDPILRVIDSKLIDTRGADSVSFDVMPAVQRWLESPKHNHGLLIEVVGQSGETEHLPNHIRLKRDAQEEISTWFPKQPLLFTYTDDGKSVHRQMDEIVSRSKRGASSSLPSRKTKRKGGVENCRRQKMHVDFVDVGWNDWIVAPQGYDAYFCHGGCPFPLAEHLNSTNHAIVQTLVNSVHPGAVPKACCVPTQLTSISMLYLDEENKVVLKNYQDMAVSGCGCR